MVELLIAIFLGIVIGFASAVPIGPVGMICVQRTLIHSKITGIVTGVGAALADGFLAVVAAFGIKAISDFIVEEGKMLRIIGGLILLFMGLYAIMTKPKPHVHKPDSALTIIEFFLSGAILTITNPLTAITFLVAFAGVGSFIGTWSPFIASSLVAGVIIGSSIWWLFLTYIADIFGHKINQGHLNTINKWFGVLIALMGILVVVFTIIK